jgi:hypothetical protein
LRLRFCQKTDLLRARRGYFLESIKFMATDKELKEKIVGDYKTHVRHRFVSSAGRAFDAAHQRIDRAFQGAQKRQSLASRLAENGLAPPKTARLSQTS